VGGLYAAPQQEGPRPREEAVAHVREELEEKERVVRREAGKTPRDASTAVWVDNITSTSRAHGLLKFDLSGQSGTVSAVSLQLNVTDVRLVCEHDATPAESSSG
jgi:hypothetical protein